MTRLWLGGTAVLLALLGIVIWRNEVVTKKLNAARVELAQKNAEIEAKDKLIATERNDRSKADESAKSLQAELDRIRAEPRITGVRCKTSRADLPAESRAAADLHAASAGAVEGVPVEPAGGNEAFGPEIDVSDSLDWYGEQCAGLAVTLAEWQRWNRGRTH